MLINDLMDTIKNNGVSFFTGVPDSLLKCFCDYLYANYELGKNHFVVNNEGSAVGLAAGYYLSTGKVPCVYMQNSGIGNAINPIVSLLNPKVYGIPTLFIVGWRGEPNVSDEPQHIFQGEITLSLLENVEIEYCVIDEKTTINKIQNTMQKFKEQFQLGKSCALIIRKNAFVSSLKVDYLNKNILSRERAIGIIEENIKDDDCIVSTTGKASRELFEVRENKGKEHNHDFLTVGSMGHSDMIALGISLNYNKGNIWCIDGDGALLMHMGSLAIVGKYAKNNYRYILINNNSHETVGGMPTVADCIDFQLLSTACAFENYYLVKNENELSTVLTEINKINKKCFVEIKTNIESRKNLGRPTTTPLENKIALMSVLNGD